MSEEALVSLTSDCAKSSECGSYQPEVERMIGTTDPPV